MTFGTSVNAGTGALNLIDAATEFRRFGLDGCRYIAKKVSIASSGDTYASGLKSIVRVAWEPDTASDAACPHFASQPDKRAGTITFVTGGAAEGILHIWAEG